METETKEVKTTTIYQGQDSNGNPAAFVTPEAAVFDENGVSLKDKLANIDPEALKSLYESQIAGIEEAGNKELENLKTAQSVLELSFDTDRFTTRKSIPSQKRYKGMIISYIENNMPILECYVGDTERDSSFNDQIKFANDNNWQLINTSHWVVPQIGSSVSGTTFAQLRSYHTITYLGSSESYYRNITYMIQDDYDNVPTFKNNARDGITMEFYTLPQSEESWLEVSYSKTSKDKLRYGLYVPAGYIGHIKLVWLNKLKGFFVTRATYESINQ